MKITTSLSSGIRVLAAIAALFGSTPSLLHATPTDEETVALNAIADKMQELGPRAQALGSTIGTLQPAAGGRARFQVFALGAIYWSSTTGAHVLEGTTYEAWRQLGAENSQLGLPVSEARDSGSGNLQTLFEHGVITMTPQGAPIVRTFPGTTLSEIGAVFPSGVRVIPTSESSAAIKFLPTTPFGDEGTFKCGCDGPTIGRPGVNCKVVVSSGQLSCVKDTCSNCKLTVTL